MITRRYMFGITAALSIVAGATLAFANAGTKFDAQAFEAAQKAGKPILVDVTAPWCSICRSQSAVLARLTGNDRFKRLVRFNVDFDSQKDVLKQLRVQVQSTLIVFKGKNEVGRSTGDTGEPTIEKLLSKSFE